MGLFKEISCACCDKKTKLITRTKLCDGKYLCSECTSIVPPFMMKSFRERYSLEDYEKFKEYVQYSDSYLRPKFHETHSFYNIHIDTENLLFYLGYGINSKTIFLNFRNISRFNMLFSPDNYKDSLLGTKVNGKIMFELGMDNPYFYHEEILDSTAKAKAKKSFFGNKLEYENPSGMDDFITYFNRSWQEDTEDNTTDEQYSNCTNSISPELRQAMALFMIDSLNEITPEKLKNLRNKFIMTFHPDRGDDDTKHAQKINAAYEIIKNALK